MKKSAKINMSGIGIASLVLIIVVLSMSVMAMLTLTSVRSDERLSLRSAQVTENVYKLYERGERRLAELSAIVQSCASADTQEAYQAAVEAALPEDVALLDGILCWQEDEDTQSLICQVKLPELGSGEKLQFLSCRIQSRTGDDDTWN